MLSKNFISLLESMKSPYNEMYEDKDERRKKKEERRKQVVKRKNFLGHLSLRSQVAEISTEATFESKHLSDVK